MGIYSKASFASWKNEANPTFSFATNFTTNPSLTKGAFLRDDPDQDQWSQITQIMVDQMHPWIHSGQGFIGSFDL